MILQKSTAENNTYNTHQMEEVSTYLTGKMYDLTAVNEATSHTIQALGHACIIHHTHLRQQ